MIRIYVMFAMIGWAWTLVVGLLLLIWKLKTRHEDAKSRST